MINGGSLYSIWPWEQVSLWAVRISKFMSHDKVLVSSHGNISDLCLGVPILNLSYHISYSEVLSDL